MEQTEFGKVELGSKMLELVKLHIDVPGLVDGILDGIVEEALKEAVAKTDTVIDDVLVGTLYPALEAVLKTKVREAWAKIL